jgi:RND family efflux transporter MFP subunit
MPKSFVALRYALVLLVLASCGQKEADKTAAAVPATPVTLVAARTTDAVYYDEYPATVVGLNTVELRSQITGFVTAVSFREGDVVQKGKTLYEIDRRQYQAAYEQAQASLRTAQALAQNAQLNLTRYQHLAQQDAVARQIVDNAATAYATAQAQIAQARASVSSARTDLDFTRIKAPVTGRVGISQVRLGSQVSAGATLLNTISGEDAMGVDFVVTDADLSHFGDLQRQGGSPGDSTFQLVLPDGSRFPQTGRMLAIDRGVNQQTATVQIRVQFANPRRQLKDGMSTVLRVLNRQSGHHVVVPYKAIIEQMGENFVFVAGDSSKVRQRMVQLGPRLRDQVVVLTGLTSGDKVVTEGLQRLRDGALIQVESPAQAALSGAAAGPGLRAR